MTLEAVFLDVGDTLLREEPSRYAIYARAARARGVDMDPERMHGLMVAAHRALPRVLSGAYRYSDPWFEAFIGRIFGEELGLEPAAVADVTEELFARFEDPESCHVYQGALDLLDALRARRLAVGVVSNWSARLPRLLEAVGLLSRLDFVLCSALEGVEKPEPALFERALERAGVAAGRALHAGDHPELDGAAESLGISFVLVDHRDRHPGTELPRVQSLRELQELLTRLTA
jgi:putative hydrolase of the HAD superfamily